MNTFRPRPLLTAIALLALLAGASALAQQGDRSAVDLASPPPDWALPPAPVRTPEGSIALMDVQPGFRVEIVAAEPLVQDPIAFAFDPAGRLWVLEWPSYNWEIRSALPGIEERDPPPSRVVLLEDADRDGRMDKRTVFAEIDWPRGLQPIGDGVLVFALPDVLFLRDTDGDGRADRREVIESGLPIPANPHSAPSSPAWAVDNWIYSLQTSLRLRYAAGRWEREPAGRLAGQWGLSQDDYGRLFFGYNGDHLRASLVPSHYAVRNPHYPAIGGIDERVGLDQEVWPHGVTASVNRRAQLRDDGRLRVFTANAGPSVYRGAHFPPEFSGNVFLAEGAGRFIRRSALSEEHGVITARNAYDGHEFLFSRDERFRPVYTAAGPDGALYIADMYRGLLEGHLFVTTFLRRQVVDRGLHLPFHGMGRIYRVRHEARPPDAAPTPVPATPRDWLPLLEHPNGFWRDAAQRAIVSAGDGSVGAALRTLATSGREDVARLHAAWALEGLGLADAELVRGLLRDPSHHVRVAALRLSEPLIDSLPMLDAVLALAKEPNVQVRRQLVYSLGASRLPKAQDALFELLMRDADEPFVVHAALSGLAGREGAVLEQVIASGDSKGERSAIRALITALALAITNEGREDGVERLIGHALHEKQPAWRATALLQGMAASTRTELPVAPERLAGLRDVGRPELRTAAQQVWKKFAGGGNEAAAAASATGPAAAPGVLEMGRAGYAVCAGCHQADGRGLRALAPSLHGTPRVTGPPEALIDIVLNGTDEDAAFPSMPPLAGMRDDQLAAILTYVRQAWGNDAPPITAEDVRQRRMARANR